MGLVAQNLWNSVERGCNKSGHIRDDALEPFHQSEVAKNANVWPNMTKNAYFEPNLAGFVPNILIFMGGSKIFSTHITGKPPRHLVRIIFWSALGPNGPKMPI